MEFLKKELSSIKAGFKENIHKKQYWVYALSILIPIIVAVYNELGRSVDTNTLVVLGNVLLGILGISGLFSASSSVSDEKLNPDEIAAKAQELTDALEPLTNALKDAGTTVSTTTASLQKTKAIVDSIDTTDSKATMDVSENKEAGE
ncbi:putative holin [Lactobacillus phage Dionysus]|nr:putative holin [Lactobacillus phage Dionysus]